MISQVVSVVVTYILKLSFCYLLLTKHAPLKVSELSVYIELSNFAQLREIITALNN